MRKILTMCLISGSLMGILSGIMFTGCSKNDTSPEPTPVINWQDFAHFTAVVTESVVYGQTPEGLRVDLYFEGPITGDSINGFMSGIDYYLARPNDPDKINAYATIFTNDDALITVHITGFVYDDGTIQDEIVNFESGYKNYSWLNNTQLTGNGMMTSDTTFEVDYFYAK